MEPNIRPILQSDTNALITLNNQFIPAVTQLNPHLFARLLSEAKYSLSLTINEDLIGFLLAFAPGSTYDSENYQWFESRYDNFLYVDRIVIKSSHHGQGFGSMLYDHLRALNSDQYLRLTCEVNTLPLNESSLGFHQHYGFRGIASQKTEKDEKHVLLMKYNILSVLDPLD